LGSIFAASAMAVVASSNLLTLMASRARAIARATASAVSRGEIAVVFLFLLADGREVILAPAGS
jgi:hypothetical protein